MSIHDALQPYETQVPAEPTIRVPGKKGSN